MLLSYISKELSLLCFSAVYAYIILIRLVLTLVSGLYSLNIQRKELLFLHCHHFWVLTLDWSLPILTSKLDYFHFIPDLPCTAPLGILFISFLCIKIFRPLARDLVFFAGCSTIECFPVSSLQCCKFCARIFLRVSKK